MTKPADKWMHCVENIERQLNTYWSPEYREIVARALEATDKAATERAAQIASERRLWPSSATLHTVGEVIAAAIRKGADND